MHHVEEVIELPQIETIFIEEEKVEQDKIIKMRKKPWLKRIFSKTKWEYYTESNSYSIYEGVSGDPGNLDIQGCINIRTLPKGLVVLGDFYIQGSFIESLEDEQIRELCDIKGQIIRTPEEEDVLEP